MIISIVFEALTGSFNTDIQRSARRAQNDVRGMERNIRGSVRNIERGLFALKGAFIGIVSSRAIKGVLDISDAYRSIEGRLKLVTSSTEQLAQVQESLFGIAQETRSEYEGTANVYARLARNSEELGASQQELLEVTEAINKATIVSGASAENAAQGLLQLSQAFASGTLQGDEFRSVLENTPRLAQAIADGVGVTIGELRKLSKAGELTADRVFKAILSQKDQIEREFTELPTTVAQSFQVVENAFNKAIASADTSKLTESIARLAETLSSPSIINGLTNVANLLVKIADFGVRAAAGYGNFLERFSSSDENLKERIDYLNKRIKLEGGEGSVSTRFFIKERDQLQRDLNPGVQLTEGAKETQRQYELATESVKNLAREILDTNSAEPLRVIDEKELKKQQKAAESALKTIQDLQQSLRQDLETEGLDGAALLEYRLSVGDLSDELRKAGEAGQVAAQGAIAYQRSIDAAADEQEYFDKLLETEADQLQEITALYDRHYESITGVDSATRSYQEAIKDLNKLRAEGIISTQQYHQAILREGDALDKAKEKTEESANSASKFAERAAEGIQQAFADFFFDPFDEGLKGLISNLQTTLDRAAAEILASQLAGFLFGDKAGSTSSGFGEGFLGKIGGFISGFFNKGGGGSGPNVFGTVPGRASGGPVSGNSRYMVGEVGPELFIPNVSGRIVPNNQLGGGMSVTINQSVTVADGSQLSPRSRQQIASETAMGVQRALARHNGR